MKFVENFHLIIDNEKLNKVSEKYVLKHSMVGVTGQHKILKCFISLYPYTTDVLFVIFRLLS